MGGYEMKRPNFFIVGAPKSGTTALYEYLLGHPNVFMPRLKEPHYFACDRSETISFVRSFKEYLDLFKDATDTQLAIGEASTSYLYLKTPIRRIFDFDPNAKLIAMVRNPIEVSYAYHGWMILAFNEDERDFEKAWQLQNARKKGAHIPRICHEPFWLQYADVAKVGEQIEWLLSCFALDQVKIIGIS